MHRVAKKSYLNGKDLQGMFTLAANLLKQNVRTINAINVFPVADGDTGTNMLLTMRAATVESYKVASNSAAEVANALARGALLGAKGNSGAILSQFFRGFAITLEGKVKIGVADLVSALKKARELAYVAVNNPIEGTLLTVIDRIAKAAAVADINSCSIAQFCELICKAAREAVKTTPSMLPVLQTAGVVDAGGQAFSIICEGLYLYVKEGDIKELPTLEQLAPGLNDHAILPAENTQEHLGYCTNFIIYQADISELQNQLKEAGGSIVVIGDSNLAKVHVHTASPGQLLKKALNFGRLGQVQIDNMDEQHKQFMHHETETVEDKTRLVVILDEPSFVEIFLSLNVSVMLPDETNISHMAVYLDELTEKNIILLNLNKKLPHINKLNFNSHKNVKVINLKLAPQALSAVFAYNTHLSLTENIAKITAATKEIQVIEIHKQAESFTASVEDKVIASEQSLDVIFLTLIKELNMGVSSFQFKPNKSTSNKHHSLKIAS